MITLDQALEPVRKQVNALPSHDDHITVFGLTLGNCRELLKAAAAVEAREHIAAAFAAGWRKAT